ncbi:MAG: hypothetical protein ACYC96_05110 [Fimbriimonadaceae bacterium]
MLNRLPPDIDRMLWEVAESQDTNAFDDFEKRFPNLVAELGKRIQLVRELRDARGNASGRPMPTFDRRAPAKVGMPMRAVAALCVLTVACIGLGAFVVTSRIMRPQAVIVPPPNVNVNPPQLPAVGPGDEVLPNKTPLPKPESAPTVVENPSLPLYLKPQDVKFERAKLQIAILAVASSGGLEVEFAPNMPNPEIRMDYRNMSALDILKDLGPRFHFTAFKEGPRQILVVPEVDPNATQLPPATGTGYAANLEAEPTSSDPSPSQPKRIERSSSSGPS